MLYKNAEFKKEAFSVIDALQDPRVLGALGVGTLGAAVGAGVAGEGKRLKGAGIGGGIGAVAGGLGGEAYKQKTDTAKADTEAVAQSNEAALTQKKLDKAQKDRKLGEEKAALNTPKAEGMGLGTKVGIGTGVGAAAGGASLYAARNTKVGAPIVAKLGAGRTAALNAIAQMMTKGTLGPKAIAAKKQTAARNAAKGGKKS